MMSIEFETSKGKLNIQVQECIWEFGDFFIKKWLYIVMKDFKVIASAYLVYKSTTPKFVSLDSLFVETEYRGLGIAIKLNELREELGYRIEGVLEIRANVLKSNKRFLKKFKENGYKVFDIDETHDVVQLRKILH